MSLVALKKKTYAQKNLSGKGPQKIFNNLGPFGSSGTVSGTGVGFSLVGGYRNIGSVGPTNLSKSVSRTRYKGILPMGNGGCCGTYLVETHNSGSCCTNNNNVIKTAVLGTKGMLSTKYKGINSQPIFKEDDNTPYNKSSGLHVQNMTSGNICVMPADKQNSVLECTTNNCTYFIGGKKYIREYYTKHTNQAMSSGQYTLAVPRRCLRQ
jgi:hypothetical protein